MILGPTLSPTYMECFLSSETDTKGTPQIGFYPRAVTHWDSHREKSSNLEDPIASSEASAIEDCWMCGVKGKEWTKTKPFRKPELVILAQLFCM